ncbi:MAG TPA: sigma-70 family RNA polymerase sigma factor [Vicinamibacterales bacterium]|nr:sigma-70 family RNA polymerase sigma factor [Vicinamibacterales bacterium]
MHRIERAAGDVHRFVSQRVANRADAADISQETLLVACAKLHTFRGEQIHGWLFAIARRLIVDYYRARTQVNLVAMDVAADSSTEPALRTPPDAVLATCDFRQRLNGWFDRCDRLLRPGEQVAVMLADVYEYRDKDSAAMLRMSVPSFKLLLHRSRARLRELETAASPVGVGTPNIGVICHLSAAELRGLRQNLLHGIRLAAMTVWNLISDVIDVELMELLLDL